MALNTISIVAPAWFTLPDQKDDDDPAQFLLKGLNGYQKSQIHGEIIYNREAETLTYTGRGILFILTAGMSDWRNINHDGKVAEFSDNMVENMILLDIDIQRDLVTEILLRSSLMEEERKNLSSRPKSGKIGRTTTAKPAEQDTATETEPPSG